MFRTLTSRRHFCLAAAAVLVSSTAMLAPAAAAGFPDRPIKLVVPFAPGGNTDLIARLIAQPMAQALGQPVVVENVAGANGSIGANRVANASADGYTLLFGTAGTQAINQSLYRNLSEKNLDDYTYLGLVTYIPNLLVINQQFTPVQDVAGLIEHAKAQEGGLNYGSPGAGSSVHLSGEMFKRATDIPAVHIPYKGSSPALTDLAGGQIDFIFENITPALGFVQGNKLQALAIASEARSPILPDVPTMQELGYADFITGTWNGILAPKGTPPEVAARLTEVILQAAADPAFQEKVMALGGEPRQLGPDEFRAFTQDEYQRWHAVIEAAGLQKL